MIVVQRIVSCLLIILGLALLSPSSVMASSPNLIIDQIQAGAVGAATQEYIALYNNSDQVVDVTGWCLSSKNTPRFGCLTATQDEERLFVKPRGYITIASDAFATTGSYTPDVLFPTVNKTSGSVIGSSDIVSLMDAAGQVIDRVEWMAALDAGSVLQRQVVTGTDQHIDTDNTSDLVKSKLVVIPKSGLYEVVTVIDVCANIVGLQSTLPDNMIIDSTGACSDAPLDLCPNLPDRQSDLPLNNVINADGDCVQDECQNLDDIQADVPDGYVATDFICQQRMPRYALLLTELLPNVSGDDTGREFIELYNPNDLRLFLGVYRLVIGGNDGKVYTFPDGSFIEPHAYYVLTNSDINYTLTNTGSQVQLLDDNGLVIDQTIPYIDAKDDTAWALIEGEWRYTNRPTPGASNLNAEHAPVLAASTDLVADPATLAPCGEGKYRNPVTNRCRTITVDVPVLTACSDGEYRNQETNRCRKIATTFLASLTPCKDDQYRSEETNRCRSITAANTNQLAPCKDGQERNPETNRCRTIATAAIPPAAFAVEPIAPSGKAFVGWWALGGIGVLAAGYGIWEWHREIAGGLRRLFGFLVSHK